MLRRFLSGRLESVLGDPSAPGSHRCRGRNRDRDRFRRCIDSDGAWWLVLTHGVASLPWKPGFLCQNPIFYRFDSDSDTDPDPDYKPLGFGHFFIVRLRRDLAAAWSRFLAIRLLLVPIGVGVGIGIGIDSDDVSIPPAYGGCSSRMV
jgi:hypothetical protein